MARAPFDGIGERPGPLHRFRRISRSVAAKLFVVVFGVLLVNLAVLGYVNVRLHREHLELANRGSAERMTDIVRRSTSYYMLRNDREALRHIVSTIGKEPGITRLRILNHEGRVGFAGGTPRPSERVLSISTPINNSPTCSSASCHAHPASQHILGTLDLQLSLADADADVGRASQQFIAYSSVVILIILATIGVLMWFLVHEPVRALRQGTDRLRRGDLGVQIPVSSRDELGTLAHSFNEMSRQLCEARRESNAWARTLEQRVEEKTAELQGAHDQMIQAEKLTSLGKLAAVVAHEINNPLSGILTYAKLLRKWIDRGDVLEQHREEMHDSLQLIESESRRCGDIVRNLLTFARVHPLNITDVDVNSLVKICIRLVEHKLDLGNIAPHLELDPSVPTLRGDAGQIEQLLLAMIMNAIEAMPREGMLHVATSSPDPGHVVIRIEDDGVGIPEHILSRLFEPFVSTKEDGKGVGLGLAISRAIVDRHHGEIAVQSEAGRGTTFTITLPSAAPPAAPFQLRPTQEVYA